MKTIATLLVSVGALVAAGCGDSAPPAQPKFKDPPKAQLAPVDAGSGVSSGGQLGGGNKVK